MCRHSIAGVNIHSTMRAGLSGLPVIQGWPGPAPVSAEACVPCRCAGFAARHRNGHAPAAA